MVYSAKMKVVLVLFFIANVLAQENVVLHNLGTICISDTQPVQDSNGKYNLVNECDEESCSGRLWIYFSDSDDVEEWGTINDDNNLGRHTRDVACHQLGYKESIFDPGRTIPPLQNEDIPIWLTDVHCDTNYFYFKNILQCDKSVNTGYNNHEYDVILHCGGGMLHPDFSTYHDGEIFLSPPDEKPNGMQTSIGVVQIKLWDDDIKSINIYQPSDVVDYFSSIQRNALCQQMGFIGAVPGSVYSMSALNDIFSFTKHIASSWFSIDTLNDRCTDPVPCFSCCYDYPQDDMGCSITQCAEDDVLVISCFYDTVSELIPKQENCSFSNKKLSKEACGDKPQTYKAPFIAFLVLFILVIIICVLFCLWILYKKCRHNGYDNIQNQNS